MIVDLKNTIKKSELLWRFTLHILTGAMSVAIHYTVMSLMLAVGVSALFSSSIGFFFGALTRFITAYYHVFEPSGSVQETIPKFLISIVFQGLFNFIFLDSLISFEMNVWVAQILTTVSVTFLNFIIYRIWVFK